MTDAARIADIQRKVELAIDKRIVMWAAGVQLEDVMWLLDQISTFATEVERLTARLADLEEARRGK